MWSERHLRLNKLEIVLVIKFELGEPSAVAYRRRKCSQKILTSLCVLDLSVMCSSCKQNSGSWINVVSSAFTVQLPSCWPFVLHHRCCNCWRPSEEISAQVPAPASDWTERVFWETQTSHGASPSQQLTANVQHEDATGAAEPQQASSSCSVALEPRHSTDMLERPGLTGTESKL